VDAKIICGIIEGMKLTDKQVKFAEEYLVDLNATQAAIRAGYSKKFTNTNVSKLLQNTSIHAHLAARRAEIAAATEITPESVIRELAKIGYADIRMAIKWGPSLGLVEMGDKTIMTNGAMLVDSDQLDDSTAAAIAEISQTAQGVKLKMHDKRAALVDIGRHLGIFVDKVQHTGNVQIIATRHDERI